MICVCVAHEAESWIHFVLLQLNLSDKTVDIDYKLIENVIMREKRFAFFC